MTRRFNVDIQIWLELHFDTVKPATFPLVHVNCPYCHDTKHRLYIAVEEGNNYRPGWGWCHNEEMLRPFVDLYAYLENISDSEAHEKLFSDDPEPPRGNADNALLEYFTELKTVKKEQPKVVWPNGYVPLYNLTLEQWQKKVPSYLTGRGINQFICDKYYLGYCTNDKYFAGRLIVPIYQYGKLVGFQGRGMHDGIHPKYRFMHGISAGDYLFNLDNALFCKAEEVILVEGVFDVWGMLKAGYPNVVASFGKHLTQEGIKILIKNFKSVLVFWDRDAQEEIIELANQAYETEIKVSFLKEKDPGEAPKEAIIDAINSAQIYSRKFKWDWLIDSNS